MKIYISGQITGLDIAEATKLFEDAETMLIEQGYKVINPMKLPHKHGQTWREYMVEDIDALMQCNSIFMLKNWGSSKGARIERMIASEMEFKIYYEK
jgi:hypothetical protein